MRGLIKFTDGSCVGKKKEYITKDKFIETIKHELLLEDEVSIHNIIETGYVRFYPRGTEESSGEFGGGEPVYQFVDEKGRGVIEVFVYNSNWLLEENL